MYSIAAYGAMISDAVRTGAYARALQAALRPGGVVVDLGAGTGIFALLAARHGARRVYAIEPGEAIHVAREIAAANGLLERIEFLQGRAAEVTLPERADVLISDLRGTLPLFRRHLPDLIDARERLLAPGGTVIARRDRLQVAPVEAAEIYADCERPWRENAFGLDMRAARRFVTSRWVTARFEPAQLLGAPRCWGAIDYLRVAQPDLAGRVELRIERPGTGHGLALWFDAELCGGVTLSNAPGAPPLCYGNGFLPWSEPLALRPGDTLGVALEARLLDGEYLWRWHTTLHGAHGGVRAALRQSSFGAAPLSAARLRRAAGPAPALSEEGEITRRVLQAMAAGRAPADIARELGGCFPQRFADGETALERVEALARRFGAGGTAREA